MGTGAEVSLEGQLCCLPWHSWIWLGGKLPEFSYCGKTLTEATLGQKSVCLASRISSITSRSRGRNRSRHHRGRLLTGLLPMAFSANSYTSQGHLPSSSTAHSRLGSPTSTIYQENAPQTQTQANQMEAIPKLRVPCPR